MFFFFQAEDGIRDLVRSRGLGDVYKRQLQSGQAELAIHPNCGTNLAVTALLATTAAVVGGRMCVQEQAAALDGGTKKAARVIAAVLADVPGAVVHCIESKLGKAAFLQEAARQMKVPVKVWARRIEDVVGHDLVSADVVCARALAPLKELLRLANPLLKTGAVGIFPKGQDVASELTDAAIYWKFNPRSVPSVTDPKGRIIVIQGVERRAD